MCARMFENVVAPVFTFWAALEKLHAQFVAPEVRTTAIVPFSSHIPDSEIEILSWLAFPISLA